MKVTAMTQQTDPVATAKAIVESYLERSMVPDPEGAAAYDSDDFKLVFTGGRIFAGPAESAAPRVESLGKSYAAPERRAIVL